jgi:hypothetical protein
VSYSGAARDTLREFAARAVASGQGPSFAAALKEFDRLLHLYPQFGEPLTDLTLETGQVWRGTVAPLVMRYAIYEERRLVVVAAPPLLLPNSGF